jgi:hypothetical protein
MPLLSSLSLTLSFFCLRGFGSIIFSVWTDAVRKIRRNQLRFLRKECLLFPRKWARHIVRLLNSPAHKAAHLWPSYEKCLACLTIMSSKINILKRGQGHRTYEVVCSLSLSSYNVCSCRPVHFRTHRVTFFSFGCHPSPVG